MMIVAAGEGRCQGGWRDTIGLMRFPFISDVREKRAADVGAEPEKRYFVKNKANAMCRVTVLTTTVS